MTDFSRGAADRRVRQTEPVATTHDGKPIYHRHHTGHLIESSSNERTGPSERRVAGYRIALDRAMATANIGTTGPGPLPSQMTCPTCKESGAYPDDDHPCPACAGGVLLQGTHPKGEEKGGPPRGEEGSKEFGVKCRHL